MSNSPNPAKLRDGLLAALDMVRDSYQASEAENLSERCYHIIRRAVKGARVLPPAQKTFQSWFHTSCRHPDGSDYSRSQRARFVQSFNKVGLAWYDDGMTPELLRVCNYRRRGLQSVANPRVCQQLPSGQFQRLLQAFLERLESEGVVKDLVYSVLSL